MDKDYQLAIASEDLQRLGLDARQQPALGSEAMVLALISTKDEFLATANLMAPIVLNVKTRRGLQAIRHDSRYTHQHPVAAAQPTSQSPSQSNATEGAC
jgi:flagellar assembly factor FliW